jgi:hypothetical protein
VDEEYPCSWMSFMLHWCVQLGLPLQIGCTSLHLQKTFGQNYHITKNDGFVHSYVSQAQWQHYNHSVLVATIQIL